MRKYKDKLYNKRDTYIIYRTEFFSIQLSIHWAPGTGNTAYIWWIWLQVVENPTQTSLNKNIYWYTEAQVQQWCGLQEWYKPWILIGPNCITFPILTDSLTKEMSIRSIGAPLRVGDVHSLPDTWTEWAGDRVRCLNRLLWPRERASGNTVKQQWTARHSPYPNGIHTAAESKQQTSNRACEKHHEKGSIQCHALETQPRI